MPVTIRIEGDGLDSFARTVEAFGEGKARGAFRRAVNDAGRKTRTATQRALAEQTGLKVGVTRRALRQDLATTSSLAYVLRGKGGPIRLKYFGARETRKGVSAAPRGQRKIFAGTFIKGGRFPGRVGLDMGGQVFEPAGGMIQTRLGSVVNHRGKTWGRPFDLVRSDVVLPDEMVRGATEKAFSDVGLAELDRQVSRQIELLESGKFS